MKKNSEFEELTCSVCKGQGYIFVKNNKNSEKENKLCPVCEGYGIYFLFNKKVLENIPNFITITEHYEKRISSKALETAFYAIDVKNKKLLKNRYTNIASLNNIQKIINVVISKLA